MGEGSDFATPGKSNAIADVADAGNATRNGDAVGKRALTDAGPADAGAAQTGGVAPGSQPAETSDKKPTISGTIVEGGALSDADVTAINEAAKSVPKQFRRYVAYGTVIKVGGSLAWRANNPGNLRDADTKIGSVSGAVGTFAVFATMEAGRAAQRSLYLNKYGSMTVRAAIQKLTPPSENDTDKYLKQLQAAGVDLDKDVQSQIDVLMPAVEASEGMITGVEVPRSGG
jgi:hypothetical protein